MQRLFYLLLFIALPLLAGAQSVISGRVTDAQTGEPLIGATITLPPTGLGTVTDLEGYFHLPVTPGTYALTASYTGYQSQELAGLQVSAAQPVHLLLNLKSGARQSLNEVVVRGSLKKDNIRSLYLAQKNAASISDGIPADIIRRSPDRHTADVLKRVSGASVQDGKFVTIRGLGDRYNTALLDHALLPGTEPNRKAFSFDIVPAGVIDQLVITKAATPDLPGDFTGGLIHILTKSIPEENFGAFSLNLGYRAGTTGHPFRSGYRAGGEYLAFPAANRNLPQDFPTVSAIQNGLAPAQHGQYLNALNNNFGIQSRSALPDAGVQGSLGRAYKFRSGTRAGFTAALSYSHAEATRSDVVRQYDNYDYRDQAWQFSSKLGGFLNAGLQRGDHSLTFKALYQRILEDQLLYRTGVNFGGPREVQYYAFDLQQKNLLKLALDGLHPIGRGRLDWQLGYSLIQNNQPDQRKLSYSRALGSSDPFAADITTLGRANNRLFGQLQEHLMNAGAAYTLPLSFLPKGSFKTGLQAYTRHRDFSNRYLGAVLDPLALTGSDVRSLPPEALFQPALLSSGAYYLADLTTPGDQYRANVFSAAGFAMVDHLIAGPLRAVWGLRAERYQMQLSPGAGTATDRIWMDLLPSLNLCYSINDKTNLRAAYFRSVARPEMREIAGDLLYYDYELNANFLGNYQLERSRIHNTDLRLEYFPAAGELLSVSVSYKHFDQTIENSFYGQNSGFEIRPANFRNARNAGVEMELRKKLGFVGKGAIWQRLELYVNASLVQSRVRLQGEDRLYVHGVERDYRPLTGQSPFALNASLGYGSGNGKWQAHVHYNRLAQRLFLVGQGRFGDVYESGRHLLDAQLSWKPGKRHELGLSVRDLLNAPVTYYFDQNNNKKQDAPGFREGAIDPGQDWLQQSYRPGSVVSLRWQYQL